MTTADWQGMKPLRRSRGDSFRKWDGSRWGVRVVQDDGTVRWKGHVFKVRPDVVTQPEPGELLLFCDYGGRYEQEQADLGRGRKVNEWTAPADPDGYIRRSYWIEVEP